MKTPTELRRLAAWYQDYAVRAENPSARQARLQVVDALEIEADRVERGLAAYRRHPVAGEWRRAG